MTADLWDLFDHAIGWQGCSADISACGQIQGCSADISACGLDDKLAMTTALIGDKREVAALCAATSLS